jgi:hypothetical protein
LKRVAKVKALQASGLTLTGALKKARLSYSAFRRHDAAVGIPPSNGNGAMPKLAGKSDSLMALALDRRATRKVEAARRVVAASDALDRALNDLERA